MCDRSLVYVCCWQFSHDVFELFYIILYFINVISQHLLIFLLIAVVIVIIIVVNYTVINNYTYNCIQRIFQMDRGLVMKLIYSNESVLVSLQGWWSNFYHAMICRVWYCYGKSSVCPPFVRPGVRIPVLRK